MDKISKIFDIEPIPQYSIADIPADQKDNTIERDSEMARNNIKGLIVTTNTALEYSLSLAVQTDSPRAFEVLSTLINTAAELNTKLLDTHQIEQKLKGKRTEDPAGATITNNVIFNGTTNELNKLILKRLNDGQTI